MRISWHSVFLPHPRPAASESDAANLGLAAVLQEAANSVRALVAELSGGSGPVSKCRP